jgi:hypothetical protein
MNELSKHLVFTHFSLNTIINLIGRQAMSDIKEYEMEIIEVSPEQMNKRVARFGELKYPPDRYPDS